MPGASLWLVAPGTSPAPLPSPAPDAAPLPARLQSLIATVLPAAYPGLCHPVPFVPHLTLTSGVDPARYAADGPQAWLDALPLAAAGGASSRPLRVRFGPLRTAEAFVRRATVAVGRAGVLPLARAARAAVVEGEEHGDAERTESWLKAWEPHVSLLYGGKPIDEATLRQMSQTVQDAGVLLGDLGGEEGEDTDPDCPVPENGGWEGGEVWLVPTYEEIGKWKPIARRVL